MSTLYPKPAQAGTLTAGNRQIEHLMKTCSEPIMLIVKFKNLSYYLYQDYLQEIIPLQF